MMIDPVRDLIDFLNASPVNFYAVHEAKKRLSDAGFSELLMSDAWTLSPGDRHFVTINDSALFAFIVGKNTQTPSFHIIASHCDSPGFRIKPNPEILCEGNIVKLNTEVYGGPILYTWFDRPLSIAGRVMLRSDNPLKPNVNLVKFDEPLLTIPHLAIHFNRSVNEGNPLSKQKDMLPVLGKIESGDKAKGLVKRLVAEKINVNVDDILDCDLNLYDTSPAERIGLGGEFISGGRIDNLSMVHASLSSIIAEADNTTDSTRVVAIFDNEETGSSSKQGAGSPFFEFILRRIGQSLGLGESDFYRAVANSFLISADNAHGLHPNYVEKQDLTNHPVLGGGPVIKINANGKYMTDADSSAVFRELCRIADVPCQEFVNHSDVAGGSTLGNILTGSLPVRGVDMGAPVWAMHSVRETASAFDHIATIKAFSAFFSL